jgi:hypothetical protein
MGSASQRVRKLRRRVRRTDDKEIASVGLHPGHNGVESIPSYDALITQQTECVFKELSRCVPSSSWFQYEGQLTHRRLGSVSIAVSG